MAPSLRSVSVALLVAAAACTGGTAEPLAADRVVTPSTSVTSSPSTVGTTASSTTTVPDVTTTSVDRHARPEWLGTRLLPLRPDEFGEVQPTPPELRHRAFETYDVLPPPAGDEFEFTVGPVPDDVVKRSTWSEDCPVTLDELSYITVSHWGFDQRFHTGEMIVNAAWADQVVEVFRRLHAARFPIEQMRVVTREEVDAHPTGDWNDTTSFVCRPAVGSGSWSRHAYGLAIDVNPFHNPYLKGDLVLPELASFYTDRSIEDPGVIHDGDAAVSAFADMGWSWGGNWNTLKDWMHFSDNGR